MGLKDLSTRFFIASGCPIATTTLYRCIHLQEQLQSLGYHADVVEWFDEARIDSSEALSYDVLFLYRLAMCSPLGRLIDQARELGKPVIFDTDDLIFEPELIEWHRGVKNLTRSDQRLYAEGVQRYLATLQACDATTVATPLLAEFSRQRGKPAFVHRNGLGNEMLALADRLYQERRQRPASNRIVVGYGTGTPTHDVDFQEAASALVNVLDRFPQVGLWIAGPLVLPPQLESFGERVRRFPLTDWRGWFELASQMDIALAPLEVNNIFCRAKSEIKFVEAGALGVPLIASAIDPFKDSITDGDDGLLAADEGDWRRRLTLLIEQPERRSQIGERARRTVLHRYSPHARATELAAVLPQLLNSASRSPPPTLVPSGTAASQARSVTMVRRGLEFLRRAVKRLSKALQREKLADRQGQTLEVTPPLVINWLIPEPFPGAGGDTGIFRIIRYFAEFGHECHVYVVPYNLMNDYGTEQIREYIRKHFGTTTAQYHKWSGYIGDADCTFATFWPTVENLLALPNGGRRYYLVQDFEPSFYPGDPLHTLRAENTYRAGLHCITLGPWLAKLVRERYHATADHFDFAVDTNVYWPRPGLRDARRRVCFYARPNTPRRAYELGLEALQLVKTRLSEAEIVFYGAPELAPQPSFPFSNRGMLSQDELAILFSSCDVGLVLSLTNPSFVPLEMMACRCAVVETASERLEGVLTHGRDAWLAKPTPNAIADGIVQLLEDTKLRERIVENAYQRTRTMNWRQSVRQIEAVLLRHAPEAERCLRRRPERDDGRVITAQSHSLPSVIE